MRRIRISARLYALVAFALLTMAAALTFGLVQAQDKLVAERKAMLAAMNENAITVFDAYHGQEKSGTLTREEAQGRALEAIRAMRYQDSGYFWVNDMHPKMVMHPIKPELDGADLTQNKDPNGKFLFVEFVKTVQAHGKGFVDYYWPKPGADEPVLKYSHVAGFEPWGWVVGTGVYADDLAAMFRERAWQMAGILVAAALAILMAALAIVRSVVRPIEKLKVSMRAIADEDLSSDVPETDRADEIGQMAKVLVVLRDSVRERLELRSREAEQQDRLDAERRATRAPAYDCRNPGRGDGDARRRARAAGKRRPHRRGRPDRAGICQAQGRLQHGGRRASRRHRRHFPIHRNRPWQCRRYIRGGQQPVAPDRTAGGGS